MSDLGRRAGNVATVSRVSVVVQDMDDSLGVAFDFRELAKDASFDFFGVISFSGKGSLDEVREAASPVWLRSDRGVLGRLRSVTGWGG